MTSTTHSGRLVHILGTLQHGGIESAVLRFLDSLPEYEQMVIDLDPVAGSRTSEFQAVTQVLRCPFDSKKRMLSVSQLTTQLQTLRPDIVISHNFGNHLFSSIAAHRALVPKILVTVQSSVARSRLTTIKLFARAHAARPYCQMEIAVSEFVAEELKTKLWLPRSRIKVIPNSCDVSRMRAESEEARRARDDFRPTVVMIARMDDAKDQSTLISALRHLPDVRLVLAGDGPRRKEHESHAAALDVDSRVEFLGSIDNPASVLGRADVAVLSTHTEGLSVSLIEAMAARVPVVATDIPACREVLGNGRAGLLVPPESPQILADAIRRVLHNDSLKEHLINSATERAQTVYSSSVVAASWRALLSNHSQQHSARRSDTRT